MSLAGQKAALRDRIAAEIKALTPAKRAAASALVCLRIRKHPAWNSAKKILFYAPLASEPDIWPLLEESLAASKTIALPRYVAATGSYEAAQVRDLNQDIIVGRMGIREPSPGCVTIPLNQLDLVLVPGVAFTAAGIRLGRGTGYYDRLLAEVRGIKCGIGFDCQIRAELPVEPHDIILNCILTPSR